MENFKEETIIAITNSGHILDEVMFIGSADGKKRIKIDKFMEISDFDYDNGFGAQEIYKDLIIYFKDKSYIVRNEYDGSEWWEYNKPLIFNENDSYEEFDKFKLGMWHKLSENH